MPLKFLIWNPNSSQTVLLHPITRAHARFRDMAALSPLANSSTDTALGLGMLAFCCCMCVCFAVLRRFCGHVFLLLRVRVRQRQKQKQSLSLNFPACAHALCLCVLCFPSLACGTVPPHALHPDTDHHLTSTLSARYFRHLNKQNKTEWNKTKVKTDSLARLLSNAMMHNIYEERPLRLDGSSNCHPTTSVEQQKSYWQQNQKENKFKVYIADLHHPQHMHPHHKAISQQGVASCHLVVNRYKD